MAQTRDMIPHPVTLSRHWVDPVNLSVKRGATCTIFNEFGMSGSPERKLYRLSYRGRSQVRGFQYLLAWLNSSCVYHLTYERTKERKKERKKKGKKTTTKNKQTEIKKTCSSVVENNFLRENTERRPGHSLR